MPMIELPLFARPPGKVHHIAKEVKHKNKTQQQRASYPQPVSASASASAGEVVVFQDGSSVSCPSCWQEDLRSEVASAAAAGRIAGACGAYAAGILAKWKAAGRPSARRAVEDTAARRRAAAEADIARRKALSLARAGAPSRPPAEPAENAGRGLAAAKAARSSLLDAQNGEIREGQAVLTSLSRSG